MAPTTVTVSYDGHTWELVSGEPNGLGYFELTRFDTFRRVAWVQADDIRF